MRRGTSHFVSYQAAVRYYKAYGCDEFDVCSKLADGEIHIGLPELTEGQTVRVITDEGRYEIEDGNP